MPQYPAAELQLLSIKRHHLSRDSIGKSVKNCSPIEKDSVHPNSNNEVNWTKEACSYEYDINET